MKTPTLLLFLLTLSCSAAHAQDVYNFYFQKKSPEASVPDAAVTGPAKTSAPPAAAEGVAPQGTETQRPAEPVEKKFRHFEFGVAYATTQFHEDFRYVSTLETYPQSNSGTGFGIQGGIRMNKYVALDGMFNVTTVKSEEYKGRNRLYQGSLGVLVTPVHINLFGYELFELSASTGLMNGHKYKIDYDALGGDEVKDGKIVYGLYAGARIAANLTPELAVYFDGKQMLGGGNEEIEMYQLGLKYRF